MGRNQEQVSFGRSFLDVLHGCIVMHGHRCLVSHCCIVELAAQPGAALGQLHDLSQYRADVPLVFSEPRNSENAVSQGLGYSAPDEVSLEARSRLREGPFMNQFQQGIPDRNQKYSIHPAYHRALGLEEDTNK